MRCSQCQNSESKYKCPGCGNQTCSLDCFKQHKITRECSGLSDVSEGKTTYKTKSELSQLDVHRDYNFLSKIGRQIQLGRRAADSINAHQRRAHLNERRTPRKQRGPQRLKAQARVRSSELEGKSDSLLPPSTNTTKPFRVNWIRINEKLQQVADISKDTDFHSTIEVSCPHELLSFEITNDEHGSQLSAATSNDTSKEVKDNFDFFLSCKFSSNEETKQLDPNISFSDLLNEQTQADSITIYVSYKNTVSRSSIYEFDQKFNNSSHLINSLETRVEGESSDDEPPELSLLITQSTKASS
ncbi:hypothetical protein OGAPHI_000159 [Ogataea philodendri]|uniref:HIT-type domain-containing protein n=1 Tax=Ogataea philodendri TaxID=1378263 RepID=A0A9P8TA25_9ASCO|nr:uncharacterized protein OGAPHI_000159 [Ogataea philodendri]KAH3671973.1 hypothetical protein OGAPHI_000159 [Ogataea philodendri]